MPVKIVATHPLPFHADDLVATALMNAYYTSAGHHVEFVFSRDPEMLESADAVVDTGGVYDELARRFDHHQFKEPSKAATGMVTHFLMKTPTFRWLRGLLPAMDKIDAADLGKPADNSPVSQLLPVFNPTWKELRAAKFDKVQNQPCSSLEQACLVRVLPVVTTALEAAKLAGSAGINPVEAFEGSISLNPIVLKRKAHVEAAKIEGQQMFIHSAKNANNGVAYAEQGVEFAELFSRGYLERADAETRRALESINYVVFPTASGGMSAVAVPLPDNPMSQKHPFPDSWRGLRGHELLTSIGESTRGSVQTELKGPPSEYFCHHSGFFLTMPDPACFEEVISFCAGQAHRLERQGPEAEGDWVQGPTMD